MKKLVLLFTGLLMGLTTVTAAEKKESATLKGENLITRYSYAQPIMFVERGVEFLIFPDGSFDFNTNIGNQTSPIYNDSYYRTRTTRTSTRRGTLNQTFGAPGTQVPYSTPRDRGVIITHDNDGKVRRIGNVFANYNRYDQIKRLGSVYMQYNRQGMLSQVGGLRIHYNRHGEVTRITGNVNRYNTNNTVSNNQHNEYQNYDNDWSNNDDYYYYKSNGKTKKVKKLKTLKK